MNNNTGMKMEDMHPIIEASIKNGGTFHFYPRGVSMLPTIVALKDKVTLCEVDNLGLYDVVLYKRNNGQYVLHRIVGVKKDSFIMSGDNQLSYQKGITASQKIAKAKCVTKTDGRVVLFSGQENFDYAKKLRTKLYPKHLLHSVKMLIYPFYRAIFKRK